MDLINLGSNFVRLIEPINRLIQIQSKLLQYILMCGPILPYVQTVWEEARPNIIFIHINRARKGPAQYSV